MDAYTYTNDRVIVTITPLKNQSEYDAQVEAIKCIRGN
jgi:hypothetical protein